MKFTEKLKKLIRGEEPSLADSPANSVRIEKIFSDCADFTMREIDIGLAGKVCARLCFIDGLVSGRTVGEQTVKPLTDPVRFASVKTEREAISAVMSGAAYGYAAKLRKTNGEVASDMLCGWCAVVFDGAGEAVCFELKSEEKRAVDQPKEEKVVKGSKDAFVETLRSNTALVRKKLRDPRLKVFETRVGRKSATVVAVLYIEGFTNGELVRAAKERLESIDVDGVFSSAVLEEALSDRPRSAFPQIISTERPDKFCINLLEGRVGIIADGLPLGYLAPGTFAQFFKVPEDNSHHFAVASLLTVLRYVALAVTMLLPAFYVAIVLFHNEMLPTKLMQSIIDAKQRVPFPTAVEVLGMLVAFELLQEAGLRLPNPIGETISIIGALIVGQSAVEARVVSPVVVIVVAFAGICGYTIPNQDMSGAVRIWRFVFVILSVAAGMFGLAIGSALLIYTLCSMESFGVAYMTPFAATDGRLLLRAITRAPLYKGDSAESALKPGSRWL